MRKISIAIFLLFFTLNVFAQKRNIDTTFFSDGSLREIVSIGGELLGQATISYFKISNNVLDKNHHIYDTLYRKLKDESNFPYYEGPTRIFFNEEAMVTIERLTSYGSNKDNIYKEKTGSYVFLFGDMDSLNIEFGLSKDTLISYFRIGGKEKNYSCQEFEVPGTRFKTNNTVGNTFFLGDKKTIVYYFNNNLFSEILYYNDSLVKCYEFYPNFICKRYGNCIWTIPVGLWHIFHQNGNIAEIGNYIYSEKGELKDGEWKYFNDEGDLIRIEKYNRGVRYPN